ncbi:MAG TPA: nuclear transport factor 2 family protein [Fimbriimonadaceae bacterium]|nr:nuclear transport factor 2 family protein [Fimbriimonadaceae bacterium]
MPTAIDQANLNVETVQAIFAAFGRGDVPFMQAQAAEGISWYSHFDSIVPWGGDFSTKVRMPEFFRAIAESVDVLGFEPHEFIAQGDAVVTLGSFSCRSKVTGKTADTRWIMVFRFRDGLVHAYEQFHDPAIAEIFRA